MEIGQKLKEKRTAAGISQGALAEKIGVSRQTVSSWENNHSYPDIGSILKLSDLYGVSLDELLKEDENMRKHVEKTAGATDKILSTLLVIGILLLPASMLLFYWELMTIAAAAKVISMVLVLVFLFFRLRINQEPWFVWLFALVCWGALYLPDVILLLADGTMNQRSMEGRSIEYILLGVLLLYSHGTVFKSKLAYWQTVVIYFGVPIYIAVSSNLPAILDRGLFPAQDRPFGQTYRVAEIHSQMEGVELPQMVVLAEDKYLIIDRMGVGVCEEQKQEEGDSKQIWKIVPENDPTDLYILSSNHGDINNLTLDWRSYRPVADLVWEDYLWSVELERIPIMKMSIQGDGSSFRMPLQWLPEETNWNYGDNMLAGTPPWKPNGQERITLTPEDDTITTLSAIVEVHRAGKIETQECLMERINGGAFALPDFPSEADFIFVRIPWENGAYMFRLDFD